MSAHLNQHFQKVIVHLNGHEKTLKKMLLKDTKYSIHLSSYLLLHNKSSTLSGLKQHKYPPFCFMTLNFYKRPILVPVFLNRNPKRIFTFTQKAKRETVLSVCFLVSYLEAGAPLNESGPAKLLPQELHSASQHQAPEL